MHKTPCVVGRILWAVYTPEQHWKVTIISANIGAAKMGVGRLLSSHNGRMTIIFDDPKWNPTTANPFGKIVLSRSHRPVMCCPDDDWGSVFEFEVGDISPYHIPETWLALEDAVWVTLVDAAMAKTPIDPHTYDHTYCIREGYVLSCCFSVSLVFVFFFVCPASFFLLLRFSASMLFCFFANPCFFASQT